MNSKPLTAGQNPQTNLAWKVIRAMLATIMMWLVHLVALVTWIAFMVKVVPFYKQYFEANNLELPGVTITTLDWSLATGMYWYLFVLALIVFDGGVLLGLQFLPKRWTWVRSLWFVGFLAGVLMHIGFSCIAIDLPLDKLDAAQAAPE
jgi:type II secretory pathway component PulF